VAASAGGANLRHTRSCRLPQSTPGPRQPPSQRGLRCTPSRRLFSRPTAAVATVGLAIPLLQTHPLLLSGTRGRKQSKYKKRSLEAITLAGAFLGISFRQSNLPASR